ncbi:MAG: DnaJ domain-containing protein [Rhodospirillales bacterium]|nr:DnaJ domain-containing protein [Rhodospirillales bacterium]
MIDPYQTLGISEEATLHEIKRAYRKLAKELHPDLNPDDKHATERFNDVSDAYDILTDPEKRAHHERARNSWGGGRRGFDGPRGTPDEDMFDPSFGTGESLSDLFGDIAGNRRGRGGTSMIIPGEDMAEFLKLPFVEAAVGAIKTLALPTQVEVEISISPGIADGETIVIPGYGFPGMGGAAPGNLNVIVQIEPDKELSRDVFNVRMNLPVTATQAKRGARVKVRTIGGELALQIPKNAKTGQELRLEKMGFRDPVSGRRGDQIVTLTVKPARKSKKAAKGT